jgi:heavy metal sensor kinase
MRKPSIGLRLTLWYLAIFALAQIVFGVGMWLILRHNLYDIVDDGLEDQVADFTNFLQSQNDLSIAKLQSDVREVYTSEHSGNYLQVYAGHGQWIYRSPFLQAHPVAPPEPVSLNRVSREDYELNGNPFRFLTQKVEVGGAAYTVQTGAVIDDVVETLSTFRLYLLLFAPGVLLLAAAGGYWLSRRALAPVDAIVRTAREIGGTNLDSRLQTLTTGDELQRLSDTLNEMLDRIEAAFQRVTQFTADASHELRTPIALMRTEAELALRRSREEAEYQDSLRHILQEAERTTVLIEELLALARADSGRERLQLHPVDLRQTLRAAIEGWQRVSTIRNQQFSHNIDQQESFVGGDERALRRVVDILLDNAFKYTPANGKVYLSLEQKDGEAVIAVRDTGAGIAHEEQGKIFERFYRVDKARTREQGGFGLGLSIAAWIVAQHGGSIEVESNLDQGATFRVKLPLSALPIRNPIDRVTATGLTR